MGETGNTAKAPKKSFWKGLKAEYKKIIWPDKATMIRNIPNATATINTVFSFPRNGKVVI